MKARSDQTSEATDYILPPQKGPVLIASGGANVASVVRAGAFVAEHLGRQLLLLSVIEPLPRGFWDDDGSIYGTFFEGRAAEARQALARAIEPHGAEADWPVEVLPGKVAATIARVARERNSPLIVMGSSRHRPFERLLGAGDLLRTVRSACRPVLAVSSSFRTLPSITVVGVDFSASSIAAAQMATRLMARASTLHLLHVHAPSSPNTSADDDLRQRSHLLDHLKRFASSLDLPAHLDVRCELRAGKPAERLLEFAVAHHAELIAVGRNGHDIIERILVGSVAEQVLHSATCSVMAVPEGRFASHARVGGDAALTEHRVSHTAWSEVLDRFSRQNAGRPVRLDVEDPENDHASIDRGYLLFGTSCEPGGRAVSILLGEPNGRQQHQTRAIPRADQLWTVTDTNGADVAIRIHHGSGQTVLTLTGDVSPLSAVRVTR